MIAVRIEGCTAVLGAPKDWDSSKGQCVGLPVRQELTEQGPQYRSRWQPTQAELELLNQGGAIELVVCGNGHPPVWIGVAE